MIEQFIRLQSDSAELGQRIMKRNAMNEQSVQDQFDELSAVLFRESGSPGTSARRERAG